MATDFMTLKATLGLDSSEYEQGLTNSEAKAKGFGSKAKTAFKAVGVGAAAIVTATAAVSGAFVKATGKVAEYGDNVDKMSQKMGLSAEKYQEWDAIMQHSGTSIDTMKASMKTLANAAEKGNEAFERIGLTQEQVANMSQQDLFEATISGLQNVEDTTERTYLAGQLLGRGATELGALLNTSAEDTEKMRQRVHELGGVMSDEAVKASARYTDSLQDMQTSFEGMKRNLLSGFLPSITTVMDGLANIFSGEKDLGLDQIEEGVSSFIKNLNNVIPQALSVGASIIGAIGKAFKENMPIIMSNAAQIVTNLMSGISSAAPNLIPKGIELAGNLLIGIIQAIPNLIIGGLNLITGILEGIGQGEGELLSKIGEILVALGEAIVVAAPELARAMLNLVKALGKAITQVNFFSLAKKAFNGVKSGIQSIGPSIKSVVKSIVTAVINLLGFSGIKAKVTQAFQQVVDGAREKMQSAKNTVSGWISSIKNLFPFNIGKIFSGWVPKISATVNKNADGGGSMNVREQRMAFAKAMSQPYLFKNRTTFRYEAGEAGDEILMGRQALKNDLAEAVRGAGGAINIYLNYNASDDANDMVRDIAREVQRYKMAGAF